MTPFPETVSDPNIYKVQLCIFDGEFVFSNYHLSDWQSECGAFFPWVLSVMEFLLSVGGGVRMEGFDTTEWALNVAGFGKMLGWFSSL